MKDRSLPPSPRRRSLDRLGAGAARTGRPSLARWRDDVVRTASGAVPAALLAAVADESEEDEARAAGALALGRVFRSTSHVRRHCASGATTCRRR